MASASNLDQSLSDIIASKPKTRVGGGARGGRKGAAATAAGGRKRGSASANVKAQAVGAVAAVTAASSRNSKKPPVVIPGRLPLSGQGQGSKVIVSNLPLDVTEQQVKELFSSTIGPLKKVAMSFRANGQSTGNCTVEFQRAEDGNRAYTQYNNRLIDGKRQLKIEVVVDPAKAAAQLVQAAAPAQARGAASTRGGAAAGRGGAAGRGRGGARGGAATAAKPKRAVRPKKTAEDLDAEMEDYAKAADKAVAA